MFPNFESLAQREQKRQELLERAQRRVRQANAKRDMYAGATWASDVASSITTLPKKSTESTQTDVSVGTDEAVPPGVKQTMNSLIDRVIAQSDLKKSLRDENSQTNPELSPPTVKESQSSRGSARVSDDPTNAVETEPVMVYDVEHVLDDESDESDETYKDALIKYFDLYPVLSRMKLHPLDSNDRQLTQYYIGKNGNIYTRTANHPVNNLRRVDWRETYLSIQDVVIHDRRFLDYIASTKESNVFKDFDKPLKVWGQLIGKKRKLSDPLENDKSNQSKQRLDDAYAVDVGTSTDDDPIEAKARLKWAIFTNAKALENAGLNKKIIPIFNRRNKKMSKDYVWIDGDSIRVFKNITNQPSEALTKKMDWLYTYNEFVKLVEGRNDIKLFMNGYNEHTARNYENFIQGEGETRRGILSGKNEDDDKNLSPSEVGAKTILTKYYQKLQKSKVEISFKLKPFIDTEEGPKYHDIYYFGQPTGRSILNIMYVDADDENKEKKLDSKLSSQLKKSIRWMDTFTTLLDGFEELDKYLHDNPDAMLRKNLDDNLQIMNDALNSNTKSTQATTRIKTSKTDDKYEDGALKKLHDDSEQAFKKYVEAQDRYEKVKSNAKHQNSKAARSALKAASSAVKATKAVFDIKKKLYNDAAAADIDDFNDRQTDRSVKQTMNGMLNQVGGSGLKGRGLRGAGVGPLDGVVRRGRTYNLNEIQGLATPSAYVYRQLGSKYIRIPDLDNKTLVIVQPNRRKCGPKRDISDPLQSMIRTLAFKQHIEQEEYDKLTIDDKKIFKEILAITHLQYNFHDRLEDPLESLRAEYDKLKGELELGNDNPSIIKQLKSLSVDMYSNRLISDSEFKNIIVRLI